MSTAHRASILHFLNDPDKVPLDQSYQYFPDGIMVVDNGKIQSLGNAEDMLATLNSNIDIINHYNSLIMPGFISSRYPSAGMIEQGAIEPHSKIILSCM